MEYRHHEKKVRQQNMDISKLLAFCRTTTLKNEIMKMCEDCEHANISVLYDEDKSKKNILALRKDIEAFKAVLMSEIRDEDYFIRAENLADKLEKKISEIKNEGMVEYQRIDEDFESLNHDLKILEDNLHVYEERIEIDDEDLAGARNEERQFPMTSPNFTMGVKEGEAFAKIEVIDELFRARSQLGHEYRELIEKMNQVKVSVAETNNMIEMNGGLNCGWSSSKDHSEYCKVRIRYAGRTESYPFFEECQIVLPLYPKDQIIEHTERFNNFQRLDAQRKKYLQEYKNLKDEKRRLEGVYRQQEIAAEEEKKKEDPEKKRIERERVKEQVARWKQERITQHIIEDDKKEQHQLHRTQAEEDRKRKEQEEKKQQVRDYKEKKELERIREYEKAVQETKMKRYVSSEQVQRVKQKEEEMIKKKKELADGRKAQEEEEKMRKEMELLRRAKK